MSLPGSISVGASVSLTGRYALQGRQAASGLRLWASRVERRGGIEVPGDRRPRPIRLHIRDDGSRRAAARAGIGALMAEGKADLLMGPYGSDLVRAVMPIVEERGKILWNHGGAADDLHQRGWRHLVSLASPASAYLRGLPRLLQGESGPGGLAILRAARGTFASQVAAGLVAAAREAGLGPIDIVPFAAPVRNPDALVARALARKPLALVTIGALTDDGRIVQAVRDRGAGPRVLAAVAAGMSAFGRDLGPAAEGVVGPSQWEPLVAFPKLVGPAPEMFVAEYRKAFGEAPDYPAAQAFAVGLIAEECLRRAGDLGADALRQAAAALDLSTLYGRFRIDAETGRQVGHEVLLVEWREGQKVLLGAAEVAGYRN